MKKEELQNYEPKWQLKGFPKEIITRMLDCREEQGNEKDISVFEEDNSQKFRVGNKVIDVITGKIGKVTCIDVLNNDDIYPVLVDFNDDGLYFTLDGREYDTDKHPSLLHYRDDYDYSVIDFNNLPKEQKPKRWRTEEGGCYYFVSFDNECWFFSDDTKDDYDHFDNDNYNSGNYFSTEVEAEIIAQKMNTYFKQLIQEEHEHKKKY